MNFPINIQDEEHLVWLITPLLQSERKLVVTEVLVKLGVLKATLTKKECEDRTSVAQIRNGIEARQLKFIIKGKYWTIGRVEFENWLTINTMLP